MPKYILEESQEIAKEAEYYLKGIKQGLTIKRVLTHRQFVIFYYKVVKNLPTSVIADIVGLTPSTVRSHYSNCLKKIKKLSQKP